jgi:LacI family transcriptional regulator
MQECRRVAFMLDLHWPYKRHAEVFAGAQRYAAEHGWHSILDEFVHDTLTPWRPGRPQPYDGIIARANSALLKQALRARIPLVNVWVSSPVHDRVTGVFPDVFTGGEMAAEHLLARGFRQFAMLVSSGIHMQEVFRRGFSRRIEEAGFRVARVPVTQSPGHHAAHWRATVDAVEKCVKTWPTPIAVYCANEEVGRLLAQACHSHGLRVPEDVAIVAGQNEPSLCDHPQPSLTSIDYGFDRVGYEAARVLDRMMAGEPGPTMPVVVPPTGLIARQSTDYFAVQDETVAAALAFISANSHREIGLADVAKAIAVEPRTLQNYFRKHIGRPIVAEIRRVRIERAKLELAKGKRPLEAIARDTGFGTAMHMYDVFRREVGMAPSGYRKQRQADTPT